MLDLGCGSGRLFGAFLAGGATRIVGVDGSAALLRRARTRIEADRALRTARDAGRIELVAGDVRAPELGDAAAPGGFALVVLAGVIAHLDGPGETRRALERAHRLMADRGVLVVDTLGPGGVPHRDLPLSVDWERTLADGRRAVRRSRIGRVEAADGVRVTYDTVTDLAYPDGTIARLPASFRLWYPSPSALLTLATETELEVEATYGSYDLDPLDEASDRCIAVMRRATAAPGRG